MNDVFIIRTRESEQGTEGILIYEDFTCFTMERPWKDNQQNVSCIPSGDYTVTLRYSPHFGKVYWLKKVEGRSYILIHSGNTIKDTYGCILLGKQQGLLGGQRAVLVSRRAVRQFMDKLQGKDFGLHIISAYH